MSAIRILKANVKDSQEIRRLETRVWKEEVTNKYDIAMFIRFGYVFIAKDANKIIGGICAYRTNKGKIYVCDWFVDKEYRNKKVGMRLYQKLIRVADADIVSFLDPENIPTLKAHMKLGFKIARKVKNAYGNAKGLEDGYRLFAILKNNRVKP